MRHSIAVLGVLRAFDTLALLSEGTYPNGEIVRPVDALSHLSAGPNSACLLAEQLCLFRERGTPE